MLSICIPIYNYNVTDLVRELKLQVQKSNVAIEIFCIDDCSDPDFKMQNAEICGRSGKYIELAENIGRSKIRNLFLRYSQFDYMLFLDCDCVIISDNFILNYIEIIKKEKPSVVCGGRIYQKARPEKNKLLRWKYGHLRESKPAEIRKADPDKSFMTNNFLIKRHLFEKIHFDERLSQYGHEDTLFGYQLKKNNISIMHIENPVLNGELEDNEVFIQKTEKGLVNLTKILDYTNSDPLLIEDITLLKYYNKLNGRFLLRTALFLYNITHRIIRTLLKKGFANMPLFDFYKLGYFSSIVNK